MLELEGVDAVLCAKETKECRSASDCVARSSKPPFVEGF